MMFLNVRGSPKIDPETGPVGLQDRPGGVCGQEREDPGAYYQEYPDGGDYRCPHLVFRHPPGGGLCPVRQHHEGDGELRPANRSSPPGRIEYNSSAKKAYEAEAGCSFVGAECGEKECTKGEAGAVVRELRCESEETG